MDSGGDFGGFGFFGGDGFGGHRPTTAAERTVILFLARVTSFLLIAVGLGGAVLTATPDRIPGFLIIGGVGVLGLFVLWLLRRFDLI